jgi:hypothetical protein
MPDYEKFRFTKAEEALRFFFRLRELLHRGHVERLMAGELPLTAGMAGEAADALDDYRAIGWSMRGLDDVALWLLGEVYGPTSFGVHRRTFLKARQAAQPGFPHRRFRLREIVLIHERALGVVKRGLRELGMIPVRPQRAARKHRPAATSASQPVHLRVGWTARGA